MYDLSCLWSAKFTRFTRLQIYTWQVATLALVPLLCLCVGTPGEGKIFLHFSRAISLPARPLSFHVHSNLDDIVCVCVWLLCAEVAGCWRGGAVSEAGGVLVPATPPGHHPPTPTLNQDKNPKNSRHEPRGDLISPRPGGLNLGPGVRAKIWTPRLRIAWIGADFVGRPP